MNVTVKDMQARVNAILNRDVLKVDGMRGPKTNAGIQEAMKLRRVSDPRDLFHDSGLHGIIWHWTASTYAVTKDVLSHYNDVFDHLGFQYDGGARAEHQANYDWRKKIGVSHTKNANTGRIGLSVAAMAGAEGWPELKWGQYPLTQVALDAMLRRTAEYCKEFDIPVSKWSTLSHAEVQDNLGISQNSKWDYMVLPGMKSVTTAEECGDILRKRLREMM